MRWSAFNPLATNSSKYSFSVLDIFSVTTLDFGLFSFFVCFKFGEEFDNIKNANKIKITNDDNFIIFIDTFILIYWYKLFFYI